MKIRHAILAAALAAAPVSAAAPDPRAAFGVVKPMDAATARTRAEAAVRGLDPAALDKIWAAADRSVLAKVTSTFALASGEEGLVAAAANADFAPDGVPSALVAIRDPFARSNLALAFGRHAALHESYEEAFEALQAATPDQVVDSAALYFYRAVSAHATRRFSESARAAASLEDVYDPPTRFLAVARQMRHEASALSDDPKELSNIAGLMGTSGRHLRNAKAGEKTQAVQKKIVIALDEKIKEIEDAQKQAQSGQGQGEGGQPGKPMPGEGQGQPAQDSKIMGGAGAGKVDDKKLRQYAQQWGTLPPDKRAEIVNETTRDLPEKYKPMIEEYFKSLNRMHQK